MADDGFEYDFDSDDAFEAFEGLSPAAMLKAMDIMDSIREWGEEATMIGLPQNREQVEEACGRAALGHVHGVMRSMGYDEEAIDRVSVTARTAADGQTIDIQFEPLPQRVAEYFVAVSAGEFEKANRLVKGGH